MLPHWSTAGFLLLQHAVLITAASVSTTQTSKGATPTPISFPPAQNWDGPDGPWSSFLLRVGTPAQDVRVLISSASQDTWVVVPQGCTEHDPSTCSDDRGGLFNYNQSSTWEQNGLYQLFNERNLGLSGNGLWGNDTVGLAVQGSGGPTLKDQIIAGIVTDDFYLGMFGVNPKPTNYTGLTGEQQDSYMTTLKKQNLIPSTSFGYTAGAPYRLKKVLASLTLGGYDQSRFTPNPLSFTFASDNDRDTVVFIQSITATNEDGTTTSLLPQGILAYVDTTIPYIWLPLEACQAFEKAFGLEWDQKSELYLVDDALHKKLLAQNATIDFTLGEGVSESQTVNISLPYASFDLTAKYPLVQNTSRYFPLKRAANDTQYTLGRTFLQEAYFIVDYERRNFSISQCLFQIGSQQELIGLPSVNATAGANVKDTNKSSSQATIIGISVAVVVLVIVVASAVVGFFCIRSRRSKRREETDKGVAAKEAEKAAERIRMGFDKAEVGVGTEHERFEMAGSGILDGRAEADGPAPPAWVQEKADWADYKGMHELNGVNVAIAELADKKRAVHKMYDPSTVPVELPADMPRELPGSIPSPRSARSTPTFHSAQQSPEIRSGPSSPISRPSTRPSPIDRRMGRTPQSRSSTFNSSPFSLSPTSQSGPSPPADRPMPSSPRSRGPFSPISPIRDSASEGRGPSEQIPLSTMLRGSSQPASTAGGSPSGSQRSLQSPLLSSLRSEDSRRRRRNEI